MTIASKQKLSTLSYGTIMAATLMGSLVSLPMTAAAQNATSPAQAETKVAVLNRAQIDALLAEPDKVQIIDVRRADEIAAIGSFPVFLNIQITELDRFVPYIAKDRKIVTVSNHAGRAQKAAAYLAGRGFHVSGAAGAQDYAKEGGFLYGQKVVTPAIDGIVEANTRVEVIREGFEGTEGPVALKDGSIIFTENRADRIVKIAPDNSVSTYLEKTGSANALAINAAGDLLAVQTAPSGVAVLQPKPKVLAKAFADKPLNRPNDLAVSKAGHIYFSDPGAAPQAGATPPVPALYWLDRKGKVNLIANDIRRPNGVALSPDDKTLYVANTAGESVIAFNVSQDGSVSQRRDFAKLAGFKETPNGPSSGADGIVVDANGRVYVASTVGIQIFSPSGDALGVIALPKAPQNLAFGGPKGAHLYAVGRGSVYRIATLTQGVARPGK